MGFLFEVQGTECDGYGQAFFLLPAHSCGYYIALFQKDREDLFQRDNIFIKGGFCAESFCFVCLFFDRRIIVSEGILVELVSVFAAQ